MRKWSCILLLCTGLAACQAPQDIFDLQLSTLQGAVFPMDSLKQNAVSVLVFMSPECPLCENYARDLRMVADSFSAQEVKIYGVFPGTAYPDSQIRRFLIHYRLPITALLDPDLKLTEQLDATTTPEAVVYNAAGTLVYRGNIDNWATALGQKRTVVTEHYLEEAIAATLSGFLPPISSTEPVGCLIQR